MELLRIAGVCAGYDDVAVLHEVSLSINPGQIVCLIGSNGAGKSTLLRTISGIVRATAGSIQFAGTDVTALSPQTIVRLGIAHVPEGRRLFPGMTVRENLLIGAYSRADGDVAVSRDLDFVLSTFPRLAERLAQDASTLSGGEQQMCAIARGIMARPELLMVDELSLGLSPKLVAELGEALQTINRSGLSILLVEQDVETALQLAHYGFVLDTGCIVLSGPASDLADNELLVQKAYLGTLAA